MHAQTTQQSESQARIEKRITQLERRNRVYCGLAIALGLSFLAGMFPDITSTAPDVVQAKKIEIVNDPGVAVVTLQASQFGGWIQTTDNEGNAVVAISGDNTGAGEVTINGNDS